MSGFSPARVSFFFLATLTSAPWASSQAASEGHVLPFIAGNDSVVRFFYQPPKGEYFHVALLFRVVKKRDPRWNTTAYSDVGLTAYISFQDMRRFMGELARLSLRWDQSATIEGLETYETIHSYGCGMGIKVLSPNGTAKSLIAHDKICDTLAPLDGALLTPRALWEFQGFRLQYHCRVASYDLDTYPERP
jgi:hypothetical protein